MGFAAPALAQNAPVPTDSSTSVVRADGSTVITERIVTKSVVVVASACNHSRRNVSGLRNVSGGVGGSIGGRMILGATSADDVPLPGTCPPIQR
jgi:hypothetical protein